MNGPDAIAIHATALVVGEAGIVIRGPSGSGKSSLALLLLEEARRRGRFARLVGDDRVLVHAWHGRSVVAAHPSTAGLVERRTQPFARLPHAARCLVRLVVDLHPAGEPLPRLPEETAPTTALPGTDGLPLLRLQAPPNALSCCHVFHALDALNALGET